MPILLQPINLKNRLILFLLILFLSGCTHLSLFDSAFTNVLKNDANANSDFYLNKIAQTQNLEDKQTYKLLAARVLVTENKILQAEALLNELNNLKPEQLLDKTLVESHILAIKKNNKIAENNLKTINLSSLSNSQKSRYYLIVARIAENRNQPIEAVKARIIVDNFLTDNQRKQQNNDRTWALLRKTNKGVIANAQAEGNIALGGWLALTKTYNDNINQPATLIQSLQQWRNLYPNHTAAYLFPTELKGLFDFKPTGFNQVALLLPLSGNGQQIGQIIKQGFDDARGASPVQIQVFDTITTPIDSIMTQIKQQGITAVVGPLLKKNVDTLLNEPQLVQGLNILALNSTANSRAVGQLCYYGLSPEDEAESAADRIWQDNIRKPLLIMPQNDLGQRSASAFNVRWQQLSATDVDTKFYNQAEDIITALQSGLNETQAVYIVATPAQLTELKTVIDNNAPHLKLYATSRVNSFNNGPEFRLLMNGLTFSDIPLFKDMNTDQYSRIISLTGGDYSLMRLYAMGSDAWLLINQFNELRQVPGFKIDGLTGTLSAGPNCNIERNMTWFQYQNAAIAVLNY